MGRPAPLPAPGRVVPAQGSDTVVALERALERRNALARGAPPRAAPAAATRAAPPPPSRGLAPQPSRPAPQPSDPVPQPSILRPSTAPQPSRLGPAQAQPAQRHARGAAPSARLAPSPSGGLAPQQPRPCVCGAEPQHTREAAPAPARPASRHARGAAPAPARPAPRHARGVAPAPARPAPQHTREAAPAPARPAPRHATGAAPAPARPAPQHTREAALAPARPAPRHANKPCRQAEVARRGALGAPASWQAAASPRDVVAKHLSVYASIDARAPLVPASQLGARASQLRTGPTVSYRPW